MEAWRNHDNFPQDVDRSLDPMNSLFCSNPVTAKTFNATFSQEPNVYLHDIPGPKIWTDAWSAHEVVTDKFEDCGMPANEVKILGAMACNSPAPQSFPSPEEQLSANMAKAEQIANGASSKRKKIIKGEKGPIRVFKTRSESNILEDGYKWRKYGTKRLKSRPHPRSYYKCTESSCSMKKKVEREATDPGLLITTYEGLHNHECPSVIYYIGKPIILPQQPSSKPGIVLVNSGICSEAGVKFASQ